MQRIYGRTSPSTRLDEGIAMAHNSTALFDRFGSTDHDLAYDPLEIDSWTPAGEMVDVANAVNNVEELVASGYGMDDFLCNPDWLDALAAKGRTLIEEGDRESDGDSHGRLAKDQAEGDKDHAGALALAKAANAAVFAPLRAIMDERDPAKALEATRSQLARVDLMLTAPSPIHPLWATAATL